MSRWIPSLSGTGNLMNPEYNLPGFELLPLLIMMKRIITIGMASLILTGSLIFPLGDFSLTRDLAETYHNYSKITTPEELGVLDFVGDYLLHGKELFGHNSNDKSQHSGDNVQFQHQPVPTYVVFVPVPSCLVFTPRDIIAHPQFREIPLSNRFKDKLFRPPLT